MYLTQQLVASGMIHMYVFPKILQKNNSLFLKRTQQEEIHIWEPIYFTRTSEHNMNLMGQVTVEKHWLYILLSVLGCTSREYTHTQFYMYEKIRDFHNV